MSSAAPRPTVPVVTLLAAGCLALAGCGGSSSASSSTTGGPGGGQGFGARRQALVKFRDCMRKHGVSLPQRRPGAGAGTGRPRFDPNDPKVQAALQACAKDLPRGGLGRGPGGPPGGGGFPGGGVPNGAPAPPGSST